MREETIKRGSWVAVMIVGETKTSFLLMVRAIGTKRTSNKFEANNDAATGSFVSSFFHLARSFVLVILLHGCSLIWSFIYAVVMFFGLALSCKH